MIHSRTMASAMTGAALSVVAAGSVHAAALEQVVPATIRLLYQEGRYIEFGVQYTDPDQSGEDATIPAGVLGPVQVPLTGNTGDVFEDRSHVTFAKRLINAFDRSLVIHSGLLEGILVLSELEDIIKSIVPLVSLSFSEAILRKM